MSIFEDMGPLREIDTLSREATLSKVILCVSEKGSGLKGKNLLSLGSTFFPFRAGPFSEGIWCMQKSKYEAIKVVSLRENGGKSTMRIQSP